MSHPDPVAPRRIAVVVNPTKFAKDGELDDMRSRVGKVCAEHGWAEPTFFETTEDDPGVGQAQEAVDAGFDIVCPLGGDGTVRAVASSLIGTDTPLGLLPGGTGNLLARNLELPIDTIENALQVVLTGQDRRIDVGLVRLSPQSTSADALRGDGEAEPGDPRREDEEVFLVMAGIGMDAEVMAGTNEKIKGLLGWPAYVLSGLRQLTGKGFGVTVTAGGTRQHQHARTVIVGNCGTLQGDLELIPDAELDDGVLDGVILAPRGVMGWLSVAVNLASRHQRGHPRITRLSGPALAVLADHERPQAQIDGDPMGRQHGLVARVLERALVVRVR